MSTVVSVNEIAKRKGSQDEKGIETTRAFKVLFDAAGGTPPEAIVADDGTTSIPSYGATYPGNSDLVALNIDASPVRGSKRLYLVVVKYSEKDTASGGGGAQDPNPLSRPPDISWGTNKYERVLEKDINGDPIDNSAGDPFDPPVTQRVSVPAVEIAMNVAAFDPDTYMPFTDSVNDAVITIAGMDNIPIGGAMMDDLKHTKRYENGTSYHRVTFLIEAAGVYAREILDRGWNRLPSGGTETTHYLGSGVFEKIEITNADGVKPNAPVLLNGSGQPLANAGAPVFLSFDTRDQLDWSTLNLPATV